MNTVREYDRHMLRSAFQSLFWSVLLERKKVEQFTLKKLADRLGINKSYISRSFSSPPNWQIDKISDMADALGVEIIIEARDRLLGCIYSPQGIRRAVTTGSSVKGIQSNFSLVQPGTGTDPYPANNGIPTPSTTAVA